MSDPDLWPDADTLAAGDEDEAVDTREFGDLEDGHLEADDYFARHPDLA